MWLLCVCKKERERERPECFRSRLWDIIKDKSERLSRIGSMKSEPETDTESIMRKG